MNTRNVSQRRGARGKCGAFAVVLTCLFVGPAWSQQTDAEEGPSAGNHPPAERPADNSAENSRFFLDLIQQKKTGPDLNPLQKLLDGPSAEEMAPWLKDPFRHLEGEMQVVVSDLEVGELVKPAEVDQPRILSELEVLVKVLEKACKKSGSGSGPAGANPTRPAADSTLAGGPGGMGDLRAPRKNQRKWADLTPKERQKILQSQTGEFPAGFEQILEDYYRQLAAESSSESTSETESPASQP